MCIGSCTAQAAHPPAPDRTSKARYKQVHTHAGANRVGPLRPLLLRHLPGKPRKYEPLLHGSYRARFSRHEIIIGFNNPSEVVFELVVDRQPAFAILQPVFARENQRALRLHTNSMISESQCVC